MRVRIVVLAAATAALAAGCGGSSDEAPPDASSAPAASATAGSRKYVLAVNAICATHLPRVLDATGGGHRQHYPIATFNAEAPKLKALSADFDAKVGAVVVPPGEADAAATLEDYRKESDAWQARMAAAAATGDQATFDAAYDANLASFGPISARMVAAGFSPDCNSR